MCRLPLFPFFNPRDLSLLDLDLVLAIAFSSTVTSGNMLEASCVNFKYFLHMVEPQKPPE